MGYKEEIAQENALFGETVDRLVNPGGERFDIVEQKDGTFAVVPRGLPQTRFELAAPEKLLAPEFVCQAAIWYVLSTLKAHVFDRSKFLNTGTFPSSRVFNFKEIHVDFPDWEEDIEFPSSAIYPVSPVEYDEPPSRSIALIEESRDVFGRGTVLLHLTDASIDRMAVDMVFGTKDERSAMSGAFQTAFLRDPASEQPGRRIVVPQYFDQIVALDLESCLPVNDSTMETKRWELQAVISCQVSVVVLVKVTPELRLRYEIDVE